MKSLYERYKRNADRTVRCYLTVNCNANCYFCSADISKASVERKKTYLSAEAWAEGLNRRGRYSILAGGEPFLYPEFPKLASLIENKYKVEIYSNLLSDVKPFLAKARRKYNFLVSLHPATKDLDAWLERVMLLQALNHGVRVHVVRTPESSPLFDFMKKKGLINIAMGQGDQRLYKNIKYGGKEINDKYPDVTCTSRIFLFGPDGHRYHCVHDLLRGINKKEHISEEDGVDWLENKSCHEFGYCAPCDNNIEGKVWQNDSTRINI